MFEGLGLFFATIYLYMYYIASLFFGMIKGLASMLSIVITVPYWTIYYWINVNLDSTYTIALNPQIKALWYMIPLFSWLAILMGGLMTYGTIRYILRKAKV